MSHAPTARDITDHTRYLMRVPLTVVLPTLNEAHQIAEALAGLTFADEIIVVDGGSSDGTAGIAREKGATVLCVEGTTIAAQRNAGIAKASHEWVLALDADERLSDDLIMQIASAIESAEHDAYDLRFRNFYGRRELVRGKWGRESHVRLFRRRYRFLDRRVHERLEDVASVGVLAGYVRHTPYRDFPHHLEKVVRYARLGAEDLRARGARITVWHLVVRPAWRFIWDYLRHGSYRDGAFGAVTSAMSALAAFLKYAYAVMPNADRRSTFNGPP